MREATKEELLERLEWAELDAERLRRIQADLYNENKRLKHALNKLRMYEDRNIELIIDEALGPLPVTGSTEDA